MPPIQNDFTRLTAACALFGLVSVNGKPGFYEHPGFYAEIDLSDLSPDMETLPKAIIGRLFAQLDKCNDERSEAVNHNYENRWR